MKKLRQTIEENDSRSGRIFDLIIQVFIVLSLVTFSLETLPDLSANQKKILRSFELITVIVFASEYTLRVIVSKQRLRFIFSFFGLIDLIAILPFFLSFGIDLRSLRIFRLLRLFRAFKVMRYSKALIRFHKAILLAKEEIVLFSIITLMLLFLSSVGIYYFEKDAQPDQFSSVFHSMWWAVATLTTVGYGDIYPVTVGGKIFTFFVLIIGLGIIAVPAGIIASAFSKVRKEESE